MADEAQVKLLRKSVKQWNKWREKNPDEKISLEAADLAFLDLKEANLSGANLYRATLYGSNLSDALLDEANLESTDLFEARMIKTSLYKANLSEADLRLTNLSRAFLNEAILHKANLREAILCKAALMNADLSFADLFNTSFNQAILRGADLRNATLSQANLSNTVLDNADLSFAFCGGTIFASTDLSTVSGLETIQHYNASYIDLENLLRTQQPLPEVFLRGCGVPEIVIQYLPFMRDQAIDFYSCFISHSHADRSFARRLHDTLQGRGIRCWLDEKDLALGDDLSEGIYRGIRYWDKMLICCSKSSLTGRWWVKFEIDKAFAKEQDVMSERGYFVPLIIPLDLDGYLFSPECKGGRVEELRSRVAANFRGWEHDNALFEREIERVIKALRTDGGKEPPPKSKL